MADSAFDQSPLIDQDHFREWLLEVAVPAAYDQRELNEVEQAAAVQHDAHEISVKEDQQ